MRYRIFQFLLLASFTPQCVYAEIYQWTDANGKTHFSDQPSAQHQSQTLEQKINVYKNRQIAPVTYDPYAGKKQTGPVKSVVMFSTSWCGICKQAKSYFRSKGIQFIDYDIEKNASARAQYKQLGVRGVPVILVGDERMVGFSAAGFEQLYKK